MRYALVVLLLLAGCVPATAPEAIVARPTATRVPVPTHDLATRPPFVTTVPVPTATRVSLCRSVGGLPDKVCTPGKTNPTVKPETEGTTICQTGWTATVRPPSQITDRIKVDQMRRYGYASLPASDFELDHLIPLELGGDPVDVLNLWPQWWTSPDGSPGAHDKDRLENHLKAEVCAGTVTLQWAQTVIATDWVSALAHGGVP